MAEFRPEPFRIKTVEPIRFASREANRTAVIEACGLCAVFAVGLARHAPEAMASFCQQSRLIYRREIRRWRLVGTRQRWLELQSQHPCCSSAIAR